MSSAIALLVRGLWELSDSIGYDCVAQYRLLRRAAPAGGTVRIFCDAFDPARYPDLDISPAAMLPDWLSANPGATLIYHWSDGWPEMNRRLAGLAGRMIVRWHNSTPPWFFTPYSPGAASLGVRGYDALLKLARARPVEFWVNSDFTGRQLAFLGVEAERIRTVYPLSPFLDRPAEPPRGATGLAVEGERPLRLLFVGRAVPHKGHKHLVVAAARVQDISGRRVELDMPGRADPTMSLYVAETLALAVRLGVAARMDGEASFEAVARLYESADAFVCLSEHEGFGLPVFEAMRAGVPVVGLRWTATGEALATHPLGVDTIDHDEIAARIVAAADPALRRKIDAWQRTNLLTRYTPAIVEAQMLAGLAEEPEPKATPAGRDATLEQEIAAALPRITRPQPPAFADTPRDTPDRFVTRHDLRSYEALFAQMPEPRQDTLYNHLWRDAFPRKKRLLGTLWRAIRRQAMSLNFGVVAAVEQSRRETSEDIAALRRQIAELKESLPPGDRRDRTR